MNLAKTLFFLFQFQMPPEFSDRELNDDVLTESDGEPAPSNVWQSRHSSVSDGDTN